MRRLALSHFVDIFDATLLRVYRVVGVAPAVLGTAAEGRDKVNVCHWVFSQAAQSKVALPVGLSPALMSLWVDRSFGARACCERQSG